MIQTAVPGAASPVVPQPAQPAAPALPFQPGASRPLSEEALKAWQGRVERADRKRKLFEPQWKRALERYSKALYPEERYDVNALLDYGHVETKKAHLFHETPDVQLHPVDPKDVSLPYGVILPLRQKYLNHKLGETEADVLTALHKTILDALAAAGWLACEVGYEVRTLPVPGAMNPDGSPVEIPIWERCFISRLSPMKLLVPEDWHDTPGDAAPWLGYVGTMPLSQAKRQKGWVLPAEFKGSAQTDEARFDHGVESTATGDPLVKYTKLWYRAAWFDETVWHPEVFRCLVLVEGVDEAVYHVDSPMQTMTPEGRLTDDSLIGNPIHMGALRDLPDSAYIPCDLTVGEQLSREINKFRTTGVRGRTRRQPVTVVPDTLDKAVIDKIAANEGPIPVPEQYITPDGQTAVRVVAMGTTPRDDYTAQDYVERDWQKALGTSDARSGQTSKKKVTATEIRNVSGNAAARDETEKGRVRKYFVALVRKFDTILQRTATRESLEKVLGTQGAVLWEQFRALPGTYGYKVLPDAGSHIDLPQFRAEVVDLYNMTRKDDRVNPEELLELLARAFNRDPAKFIAPPVDKTTEPPSAAISFKGDDTTNPAMGNLLLDLCANGGLKLRPETIAAFAAQHALQAQATANGEPVGVNGDPNGHGGSADTTEPVNKHQTERTGGMQGVGVQ